MNLISRHTHAGRIVIHDDRPVRDPAAEGREGREGMRSEDYVSCVIHKTSASGSTKYKDGKIIESARRGSAMRKLVSIPPVHIRHVSCYLYI